MKLWTIFSNKKDKQSVVHHVAIITIHAIWTQSQIQVIICIYSLCFCWGLWLPELFSVDFRLFINYQKSYSKCVLKISKFYLHGCNYLIFILHICNHWVFNYFISILPIYFFKAATYEANASLNEPSIIGTFTSWPSICCLILFH